MRNEFLTVGEIYKQRKAKMSPVALDYHQKYQHKFMVFNTYTD